MPSIHVKELQTVCTSVPVAVGLTIKVTSLVVAGQPPLAAIVYLIVTLVFAATFAGV